MWIPVGGKLSQKFENQSRNLIKELLQFFSGNSTLQPSPFQLFNDVLTLHLHPVGERVASDVTCDEPDVHLSGRQPSPVVGHRQRAERAGSPLQDLPPRVSFQRNGKTSELWLRLL